MESDIRKLFRDSLLADSPIKAAVGLRVYGSEIAKVHKPVYPCICFELDTGDRPTWIHKVGLLPMRIWVWTQEDYEKCEEIYELIKTVLQCEVKETSNVIRCHFTQDPEGGSPAREEEYSEFFGIMSRWIVRSFDIS